MLAELLTKQGFKPLDFSDPKALQRLYDAARSGKSSRQFAVLNARFHEQEAYIVAEAGVPGAITIATNMAGRGTDIILGGNPEPEIAQVRADEGLPLEQKAARIADIRAKWQQLHDQVVAAGGLHIVGTERHESRRVDNQLRGRAGRQGDPGSSRFFLALEDPLLRIFASDRVGAIMERLKMPEGEPIEHPWVTRAIENAQRKVEARNFDIRKQLLEYDDVANEQRRIVYTDRNHLLESSDVTETLTQWRGEVVEGIVSQHVPPESLEEQWDIPGLEKTLAAEFQLQLPIQDWLKQEPEMDEERLRSRIVDAASQAYEAKVAPVDRNAMHQYERAMMLQSLDTHWREHLSALDHLRQGIHLRGYAQKNPKQEYKREAFDLFSAMFEQVKTEVTRILLNVQVRSAEEVEAVAEQSPELQNVRYQHAGFDEALAEANADQKAQPFVRTGDKVGRNDPCPCGSGKKYKQCHGKLS
jgi:preprotein translocase subunit SecA